MKSEACTYGSRVIDTLLSRRGEAADGRTDGRTRQRERSYSALCCCLEEYVPILSLKTKNASLAPPSSPPPAPKREMSLLGHGGVRTL